MTQAHHSAPQAPEDPLLTVAEAAARLDVSRPYASMLCDAGKLGDVIVAEGGHRRIHASAVNDYLAARTKQNEGAPLPRDAGMDAGLYDLPESTLQNTIRMAAPAINRKRSS